MMKLETDDLLAEAEETDNAVIRCTLPKGKHVDYVAVHVGGGSDSPIWVQYHEGYDMSHTTQRPGVRNMIDHCDPDVRIIRESESLFAE